MAPSLARDALQAALEELFAENLEEWGPRCGSFPDGQYTKAWDTFYRIEAVLHPRLCEEPSCVTERDRCPAASPEF